MNKETKRISSEITEYTDLSGISPLNPCPQSSRKPHGREVRTKHKIREIEDNRRLSPSKSTKQSSFELTEIEASNK